MRVPLRVLVVEDSEDDALLLILEIERAGYEVTYQRVETEPDMNAALKSGTWDLVLSDFVMPRFTGVEALRVLKESGLDLPFILVSGKVGEEAAVEVMQAGAHDYIQKGRLLRLAPAIERELQEAESRRQRRVAERALKESEETLRTLINANPEVLLLTDTQGKVLAANEAVAQSLGKSLSELLGSCILNFLPPEVAESRKARMEEAIKSGKPVHFEDTKAGRYFDNYINPIFDLEGKVAKLAILGRDISERKRAEEALSKNYCELHENAQQLEHSRNMLQLIIESIPVRVFWKDRDLCFMGCNTLFARDAGFNHPQQLLGKDDFAMSWKEQADLYRADDRQVMESRRPKLNIVEPQTTPTGANIWLNTSKVPLQLANDEVVGVLGVYEDITEHHRAIQRIKDLNALLQAIKEIDEALLRIKNEKELFQHTCDLLKGVPYVRFIWIGLMQPDSFEVKPMAWAGVEEGYLASTKIMWDDSPLGMGPTGISIKTGHPTVVEDIDIDPRVLPWRQEARKRGYASSIALPLICEGQILGSLSVYSGNKQAFGSEEVEFLTQVAGDIAVGLRSMRLEQELVQSLIHSEVMMIQTVETIASMAELRDPYTTGHQQRVTRLALALAREIRLAPDRVEGLRVASLIHDIGKIVVPVEILNRPGKLKNYEMNIIKIHSQAGHDILKKIDFPWPVAKIVLQHHERLNGSGYPQGLQGSDILQEAKVLAVADVVEAMATHRPYRPARGIKKALEEISHNRGILYDPEVVEACLKVFQEKIFDFD